MSLVRSSTMEWSDRSWSLSFIYSVPSGRTLGLAGQKGNGDGSYSRNNEGRQNHSRATSTLVSSYKRQLHILLSYLSSFFFFFSLSNKNTYTHTDNVYSTLEIVYRHTDIHIYIYIQFIYSSFHYDAGKCFSPEKKSRRLNVQKKDPHSTTSAF